MTICKDILLQCMQKGVSWVECTLQSCKMIIFMFVFVWLLFAKVVWMNPCQHEWLWLCRLVPVVVGFKRTILVQAQVLGLLIRKLCQMGIKSGQMQAGNILIWNAQTITFGTKMKPQAHIKGSAQEANMSVEQNCTEQSVPAWHNLYYQLCNTRGHEEG